jgi:hypothetical protein
MYKLLKTTKLSESAVGIETIKRISDEAYIPFDPANTDYQAYLKWVEDGGVPTPADE